LLISISFTVQINVVHHKRKTNHLENRNKTKEVPTKNLIFRKSETIRRKDSVEKLLNVKKFTGNSSSSKFTARAIRG
jgi:hypothetical protein